MAGASFSDEEWQRIWACLKEHPGIYVAQEAPTRAFVEDYATCCLEIRLWPLQASGVFQLM